MIDWKKKLPKKRYQRVLLAAAFVLFVALGILFVPGVQKKIVLAQAQKFTDSFEVDYVRLLPWSLTIDGLQVSVPAADASIESIRLGFCPTKMLWRVIHLGRLEVHGARLTIKPTDSHEPSTRFPGLFASLDSGYGISVETIDVDAELTLPDTSVIKLELPQGQLLVGDSAPIDFKLEVDAAAQNMRANSAGSITVSQNESRQFTSIDTSLSLEIQRGENTSSSAGERAILQTIALAIDARLTPWLETLPASADTEHDELVPREVIIGDEARLTVEIPGSMQQGVTLSSNLQFHAADYGVAGDYELGVAAEWLEQLIANKSAPLMAESGQGRFKFDIEPQNLSFDYAGDTRFTTLERLLNQNPALPESLEFNKAFAISSDFKNVLLEKLQTGLTTGGETSILTLELSEPIALNISEPLTLLDSERTIAQFELVQIPVEWLDGVVPEGNLTEGNVSGRFTLETKEGELRLLPSEPLAISATTISTKQLPTQVAALSMQPTISIARESVAATIKNLNLMVGEARAASFDLTMNLPLTADDPPMAITAQAAVSLDRVKSLSVLAPYVEKYPSPSGLDLALDTALSVHPSSATVKQINVKVTRDSNPLLDVMGRQAFTIDFEDPAAVGYTAGQLAAVKLSDVDLSWSNPYLSGIEVSGALSQASYQLESLASGGYALIAQAPVELQQLSIIKDRDGLLRNIFIRLRPDFSLDKKSLDATYRDLAISRGKNLILRGDGKFSVPRTADGIDTSQLKLAGHKFVNVNEFAALPLASAVVEYELGKVAWSTDVNYDLEYSAEEIVVDRFSASLMANTKPRIQASSKGALRVRPRIGATEPLAEHVRGAFDVAISGLNAREINDVLPLGGLDFKSIDGEFNLRSDGQILAAKFEQALHLQKASITSADKTLINPFDLLIGGDLRTSGENLDAVFDEIKLFFASQPDTAAIEGDIKFRLQPSRAIPLEAMSANFGGDLPVLLNQPAVLPGHSLSEGSYTFSAQVHPSGDISGNSKFGNLVASKPLAVSEFSATMDGQMAPGGKGFEFSMPIQGLGKTGQSDGLLKAALRPGDTTGARLQFDFSSDVFYLNDLLASVSAIAAPIAKPKKAKKSKEKNTQQPSAARPNEEPDKKAFWDLLPLDSKLKYNIKQLYYTDYVIFKNVGGSVDITSEKLNLEALSAFFHDSPMTFNGTMSFVPKTPQPYEVKLLGKVRDFNLNQFFSELVPGVKPRAEGLFGVEIDAFGKSPNIGQFRNNLFFDIHLQSRDGLFRPLPPDSNLLIGASDVLGVVGEGLSYMPTGGFGAGALSRLVNYIKEIDYDIIDMRLTRGDSRDIVIEQALVQSPTVRLTATGGIDYESGKDVLDSPLTLDAQMNMSGKGAAILYSMDLLEDAQDDYGYYHGPKFVIRGNANEPTSNFAEIISTGAKGTVAGGVTRPISGLIGNIKHRWFGDDTKAADIEFEPGESKSNNSEQGENAENPDDQ